jgi:AAT family amino acid transporter/D-serine/D-alanine/glycine transporter
MHDTRAASDLFREEERHEREDLVRGLKDRHVQLIAIGGAIGVGLFLGSATAISRAGPGLVLAYALGGLAIFFIMRALGELLLYRPVSGSFASYAEEFVGPWAGFVTGWSYWFMWIVTGMAEITAVAVYVNFWYPTIPQWIPALITLLVLYGANLIAVRLFGEIEFWFALIKVITIIAMMAIGLAVILFGFGEAGQTASFGNLVNHGGFFPTSILGVVLVLQIVMFAYQGVELVGVTAGEAEDPERTLPHAINSIVWRILIFYIGALVIIMSVLPWTQFQPGVSPFVLVFDRIGIPAAASIINFVVITAAASSCNSGIFSTGRMLYTLAQFRQAPHAFAKVNARHVPATAITFSAVLMLIGVVLNYFVPEEVFVWVTSVALVGSLWTWGMIMYSHLKFREAVAEGRAPANAFRMPGAPVANWLVIGFLALVAVFLGIDPDTRVALYVAPIWFAILALGYRMTRSEEAAQLA